MKPKIIVCGLGRTGYRIFVLLKKQGVAVVGVSDFSLGEEGIIVGDARSRATLVAAGIEEAQSLVLAGNDDAVNLAILTQARLLNPQIRIVNRLYNQSLGQRLDRILPNHFSLSVSTLAAPIFAFAAMGNEAIGQLELYHQTWPLHEEVIDASHPWLGTPLQELWDNPQRMLIHYLPKRGESNLVAALLSGKRLQGGDRVIIGIQPQVRKSPRQRLKRLLKTFKSLPLFYRYARSVAIVFLGLLITIFVATLTYISTNLETSIVDALYFSVGMITGAGGQEQVAENSNDLIKVFTALMMLLGAGVIGICYALINDFVLGSRFKEFWDAARLPTHGHYIICGLGGIGMRIVEYLHEHNHEVAVIERDRENRFLHTARSLGVPLILEDANLEATLEAANLKKAEAIFAVTSDEMINIEIALTAKAIQDSIPVIVRNHTPDLTHSLQEVFKFQNVLCPTALSTPAFAAAALGGKILGNGLNGDLLWVCLSTRITPQHPFCDQVVKDSAMEANFVPLYLETPKNTLHGWQLLEACLVPDDILYLTIPATELNLSLFYHSS
ncbi:potassium channel family protein [Dactylococcopsis salina]|uniref:Kef-type K+ ransport system, predicted NAD-binding component n=1 Tax=Dactylococcopsis salina (strain PCC 8305) TaxID=13035 RepID=K9YVX0_DACS8|nr:NAD-binding protein [Dactylococcopsis salina]AFZ51076.1 Kef-type K+ ransport system, predicted NAD-binding component [Dactylococcopsis salina PCC 8305]